MKFDTLIIGGGLAGLISGIKLCKQNKKCAIVSSGQSALHFCSGSFDLLNTLPDGSIVTNPQEGIRSLIEQKNEHPYAKIGEAKIVELIEEAKKLFKELEIPFISFEENHYRITPIGEIKPTWLSINYFATSKSLEEMPWKNVAIFNMTGFLDFYPEFIASGLRKKGVKTSIHLFTLPSLERLRKSPSELRSSNMTNIMDQLNPEEFQLLVSTLREGSSDADVIVLPAILGLKSDTVITQLEKEVGKQILLIPTLPPSVIGIKLQQHLVKQFQRLGGEYMLGDSINKAEIENNKITKLYSFNHGDIPFIAKDIILATGSYFSQGLISTRERIYEPIFGLDINYDTNRSNWYDKNVYNEQPYMTFGIKTNKDFNGLMDGKPIENLRVIGAGLESFNPIKEGSGGGVSIMTALNVADLILRK